MDEGPGSSDCELIVPSFITGPIAAGVAEIRLDVPMVAVIVSSANSPKRVSPGLPLDRVII
jgi:hypothetical protein